QDGQVWLLDEHLQRLDAACRHFGYAPLAAEGIAELRALRHSHARGAYKLRLTLSRQGAAHIEAQPLADTPVPLRVALAREPIASSDSEFLRHKTTRRELYAPFAPEAGCFDTLLWNARGELTEFVNGNLALCLDGRWLTPALDAGLLPGTYRARLLAGGGLQTARLVLDDLRRAGAAAFFNSVRGWLAVDLRSLMDRLPPQE
ncbi:MAG TPA: aminotransferase class IV, partial [Methylibium sp.]